MITAPMIDELGGTATHQDRTRRVPFIQQLAGRTGRPEELPVRIDEPLVQPITTVPKALPGSSFGPAMNPSTDIDM
jgi:hypothetical protein